MGIISAIKYFFMSIAATLGLINKARDIQAGVDQEEKVSLEKTVERQQEVSDAPSRLVRPDRTDFDSWLHSPPGGLPDKTTGSIPRPAPRVDKSDKTK